MDIIRAAASLTIATIALSGAPAPAQETVREEYSVTHERNFDGSYTTRDNDGYSVTTRRNFDGSRTTKDNEGNSVTCRQFYYVDRVQCRHVTVRPAPNGKAAKEMPEPVEAPEPPAPSDN